MSEGNGAVEAMYRIGQAEAEQRTIKEEVRALVAVAREQNAKLDEQGAKIDHLLTLVRAHGEALDWLVREKKLRRRRKVTA